MILLLASIIVFAFLVAFACFIHTSRCVEKTDWEKRGHSLVLVTKTAQTQPMVTEKQGIKRFKTVLQKCIATAGCLKK